MRTLILALALLAASCVTAADLERRDAALARWQDSAQQRLEQLQSGTITRAEYDRLAKEARGDLEGELKAVVETVKERTAAIGEAGPITGNPLVDLIGTVLLGAAGTYLGVNRARDHRRALRGEPVTTAPAP